MCASTHPRKNLTHSIASSQCQTAGGTTVGSIPLVDASISLGPSHAPHPRRHLRAVCVARVRDLRGLAAPLGDVEWCARETARLRGHQRGGRHRRAVWWPRAAGLPVKSNPHFSIAPPQPMILGRTEGHICYDGVAKRAIGSGVEHFLHTEGVAGSNPASPTRQVHEVSDSLTSFLRCE